MQVLVDAPVWLDYFVRSALAVADLSLAEVLYAMREERHRRAAETALRKFWQVDLGGFDLAAKSAIHYNSLVARGSTSMASTASSPPTAWSTAWRCSPIRRPRSRSSVIWGCGCLGAIRVRGL